MKRIDRVLSHPWLTVRVQILLGLFFIIAALPKITDPPAFAQLIYNYKLVASDLAGVNVLNLMALALPWLELLLGLALVLGIWRRTAVLFIGALLVVFIVAISINLVRGNPIDCGCFDPGGSDKTAEQKFLDMGWTIVRDLAMLAMVVQILFGMLREKVEDLHLISTELPR
ncbi:MAG: MauE/DoxX family redox-associated membrane protein [Thermoanaerobaculia bacterium]|nr:MauE/DoxX family redox-associated membrane protein [Thermoanaerobaculia bacterium]